MKAYLAKLSLALLSTVFLLGCQDLGPVGPEGPGILVNKAGPHPHGGDGGKTLLFVSAFTCPAGATETGGQSFGHVDWGKVFVGEAASGADHVHYKLKLTDVDAGTYEILGNQDRACVLDLDNVDFRIGRRGDGNFITVKQNGQGNGGGQLNFPEHDPGTTKVWVTVNVKINGFEKVLRSPAVTVVIDNHVLGHEG